MKKKRDDGLEWLRKIRSRLAERFDHDPKKVAEHYKSIQKEHTARLLESDPPTAE